MPMMGLMMDVPLLASRVIEHAGRHHARTAVVARGIEGAIVRSDWGTVRDRAARLANGLRAAGIGAETRVASLAWNTIDHIEVFYAVLGLGAPLHTLNARLAVGDLAELVARVDDSICFVDAANLSLAAQLAPLVPMVRQWIYLGEALPDGAPGLPGLVARGALEAAQACEIDWPQFDENRAAIICFTSGSTGRPKGVVYSHRSLTLSAINMTMADMYADLRPGGLPAVCPIAPIFHANGWMMPFSAPMNGHELVLPGRAFDAASIVALMREAGVTLAGAVPTVWGDIVAELDRTGTTLPHLRTALIAGATLPEAIYDGLRRHGIDPRQTWGMTEVPGACRATPPPGSEHAGPTRLRELELRRQGHVSFLADLRIVDDAGAELPRDGVAAGHMQVRGPTVAARYLGEPAGETRQWLETGDISRLHPDSSVEVVDRAKDVIKSGGEWISSPALEAAASTHPAIAEAAAIAVPHPRWQERPLLLCVLVADAPQPAVAEIQAHLAAKLAKWWVPEDIRFVAALPRGATGKIDKQALKDRYRT